MNPYNLVAKNEQSEEELNNLLARTVYQNVGMFINLYNSGVLNRGHEDTKNILEKIKNTYKNASIARGSALIIQSPEEFMSAELAKEFSRWKSLSRLRRELKNTIDSGNMTYDTVLYLNKNGLINKVENDKIFNTNITKVLKDAWDTIIKESSINNEISETVEHEDYDEQDEYTLENPYEDNEESEVPEDTTGKDLPENAHFRFFLPQDIISLDDSFISDIYSLLKEKNQ